MRILKDNGLTIALMSVFLLTLVGQALSGWNHENHQRLQHGFGALPLAAYLCGGAFLSSLFENWESEFLQMSAYVLFTVALVQRGSSESKDPDGEDTEAICEAETPEAEKPRLARKTARPILRKLYENSLGLALTLLFLITFALHWVNSARAEAEEALMHHQAPEGLWARLVDSEFWFESFQNWQSEFLSTAVLVVLSIWLRQKGSPESKPVAAPHASTGR